MRWTEKDEINPCSATIPLPFAFKSPEFLILRIICQGICDVECEFDNWYISVLQIKSTKIKALKSSEMFKKLDELEFLKFLFGFYKVLIWVLTFYEWVFWRKREFKDKTRFVLISKHSCSFHSLDLSRL